MKLDTPYSPPTRHRFGQIAWARLDVLGIITVVSLIAILTIPTMGNVRSINSQVVCQGHLQQLTRAWRMYIADNEGHLPAAGAYADEDQPPDWTTGSADAYTENGEWLDLPVTGTEDVDPSISIIDHNKLWPYVNSVEVFRCPSDPSYGSHPEYKDGAVTPRVRSMSMNSWMGGPSWESSGGPWKVYRAKSDILAPSERFVLLDERADSINDGMFPVEINADQPFRNRIVDYPAHYHNGGANLSFSDGHVAYWKWEDPRTVPDYVPGQELQLNVSSPNNPDVTRLQSVATRSED